jgi:hypothetical protein
MAEQAKNLASSLPKRPDVFLETFEGSLARVRASITSTSAVVPTLTAQQKELALAMNASGKSAAEIAAKLSEVQGWKVSEASVQKLIDAHKKGTEAAKKHGDEIDRLVAKLSGAGLAQSVKDLDVALERLRANGPLTGQAIGAVGEEAARLRDEGARLTPALAELARVHDLATIAARNTAAAADAEAAAWERDRAAFGRYAAQVPTAIFATRSFAGAVAQVSAEAAKFQGNMAGVDMGPKFWARTFGSAKDFGASLSNAIMGALQGGGSVVNAAGGMIGQQLGTSIAGSLSKSLLAKGAGMLSQALGGMLNAVLPGVGALLGPLMSKAWNGIKSLFGGNRDGRKMVESWVSDTFGSFDSLQKQLIEKIGGPEADRLWRNLTQLSKNSSTDEARRAIEAVTEALARQKDQIDENADAAAQGAAETAAAQAEAADAIRAKYADAFKAIDDEYKKLSDSVAAEAEEAEMGAQERLDRARMAELEKQRAALEAQQNAELESKSETFDAILAGGKTVDEALRGIFGRDLLLS